MKKRKAKTARLADTECCQRECQKRSRTRVKTSVREKNDLGCARNKVVRGVSLCRKTAISDASDRHPFKIRLSPWLRTHIPVSTSLQLPVPLSLTTARGAHA